MLGLKTQLITAMLLEIWSKLLGPRLASAICPKLQSKEINNSENM